MPQESPEMKLDSFKKQLQRTVDEVFGEKGESPKTLSHYTTMGGLEGILTSQKIWAVNSRDMKDQEELRAADERIRVVSAAMKPSLPRASRALFDRFLKLYPKRRIADIDVVVYLSCFTQAVDNPAHWDLFAKEGGACLVLRVIPGNEEQVPEEPGLHRSSRSVIYKQSELEAVIQEGFQGVLDAYERLPESIRNGRLREQFAHQTRVSLAVVAASAGVFSKRERYQVEEETRHVALDLDRSIQPQIRKYREDGVEKTKRYVPLSFRPNDRPLLLEKVIVRGPEAEAAREEACAILKAAGYTDDPPPVRISSHPFAA